MGRALHVKLKEITGEWVSSHDDTGLVSAVGAWPISLRRTGTLRRASGDLRESN